MSYKRIAPWLKQDFKQGQAVEGAWKSKEEKGRADNVQALQGMGIKVDPEKLGGLVARRNPERVAYTTALNGVCFAMALKWLDAKLADSKEISKNRIDSLAKNAEDSILLFKKIQDSPESSSGPSGTASTSNNNNNNSVSTTVSVSTPVVQQHQIKVLTSNFGAISGDLPRISGAAPVDAGQQWDAATFAQKVASNDGKRAPFLMCYFYANDSNKGHAVALYRSSGKILGVGKHIYFFDPNCGEYKMEPKDLPDFFAKYAQDVADVTGAIGQTFLVLITKR